VIYPQEEDTILYLGRVDLYFDTASDECAKRVARRSQLCTGHKGVKPPHIAHVESYSTSPEAGWGGEGVVPLGSVVGTA
jgi:hypothetical protein